MKKTLYIILALLLVLILASCDRVKIELQEPEEPISEDVGEPSPEKEEIPEGYREIDFREFTVLVCDDSFANCAPGAVVTFVNTEFVDDTGEDYRIIAQLLRIDDLEEDQEPFALYDEKFASSVNTVKLSLGGFSAKKYHIQTQVGGPLSTIDNTIFYCIDLDGKMVTFAYYPVMGFGGLHTEDIEAILDTIRIS